MSQVLPAIPMFVARSTGLIGYAAARHEVALSLRNASFAPAPAFLTAPVLAGIDKLSMRWLRRSASPYVDDIEAMTHVLGFAGVATINIGYQFGCTTGAALDARGNPLMRRVLDCPLNGLGRGIEVVRMRGPAGDYLNITWPGAAGVLTATAPGRFCAAINQAPLHRRTQTPVLKLADMARHLNHTLKYEKGWPPDHLLRYAFETCRNFDSAVNLLMSEPVARPVIYSLAGEKPHEMALIERDGRGGRLYRGAFAKANDWQIALPDWEGRGVGRDKRQDNFERQVLMQRAQAAGAEGFLWVAAPILKAHTRIAVEMTARGEVKLQGYDLARGEQRARPATQMGQFTLAMA